MQDLITDNLPEDVGDAVDGAVEEIKGIFDDAATGFQNDAVPEEVMEATSKIREVVKNVLYYLSDYYLVIGIILVLICIAIAVFARKNKGSRRRALIAAFYIPVVCFSLYIGGFIYCDTYVDGNFYKATDDLFINAMRIQDLTDTAYVNMYKNAMTNYMTYGVTYNGVSFNVRSIAGALFMSVGIPLALSSIFYGIVIQCITVRDVSLRRWGAAGLLIIIPISIFIGTLLYMGFFQNLLSGGVH